MMRPYKGRPPAPLVLAGVLIFLFGIFVVVGSVYALPLPDPITSQGERIEKLYWPTVIISMLIYFGVTAGLIWAIFRYRRTDDILPKQVHGSSLLEFGWTIIPIIILVGLYIPSLILLIDLKTPPAEADIDVEVEAIGHQWWWEFNYPDDNVRVQTTPPNFDNLVPPRLVVPVGQTVRIKVRSTDVVHSFYAPRTLYKVQAIPGNVNQLHFKVEKAGVYSGQCYQFCGLRHADMRFILDAREPADYQRWLTEQRRAQAVDTSDDLATSGSR